MFLWFQGEASWPRFWGSCINLRFKKLFEEIWMKRVVVFGYGAVGREVAKRLVARGDDVVVAQRSAPSSLPESSSFRVCDITEPESTAAACAGRDIAICAVGFRYDRRVWERSWPAAMQALLSACSSASARFVFADNR